MHQIFSWMKEATPFRNPLFQIIDVIWHKLKINTYPSDYYRFQFYRRDKTWEEKGRHLGRMGSRYWPWDSIALKDMALLTNKYIHKHLLIGMGLPTPELLASVGHHYDVQTLDELKALLESWRFDIVVKPIRGARGSEVAVLSWENGRFIDGNGDEWSADRLWEHVSHDMEGGSLIERRVFNVGHTAQHFLRFGCGKLQVDNIHAGGIIITHHPDTGKPLIGFRADGFDEVLALCHRASNKFAMVGTMGWDIAYTSEGPMIIECNAVWGALYQVVSGPILTEEIAAGLNKKHAFSRYPRDRAFPGLQKISRWPWRKTRWWA
jgi:hypothetical protein